MLAAEFEGTTPEQVRALSDTLATVVCRLPHSPSATGAGGLSVARSGGRAHRSPRLVRTPSCERRRGGGCGAVGDADRSGRRLTVGGDPDRDAFERLLARGGGPARGPARGGFEGAAGRTGRAERCARGPGRRGGALAFARGGVRTRARSSGGAKGPVCLWSVRVCTRARSVRETQARGSVRLRPGSRSSTRSRCPGEERRLSVRRAGLVPDFGEAPVVPVARAPDVPVSDAGGLDFGVLRPGVSPGAACEQAGPRSFWPFPVRSRSGLRNERIGVRLPVWGPGRLGGRFCCVRRRGSRVSSPLRPRRLPVCVRPAGKGTVRDRTGSRGRGRRKRARRAATFRDRRTHPCVTVRGICAVRSRGMRRGPGESPRSRRCGSAPRLGAGGCAGRVGRFRFVGIARRSARARGRRRSGVAAGCARGCGGTAGALARGAGCAGGAGARGALGGAPEVARRRGGGAARCGAPRSARRAVGARALRGARPGGARALGERGVLLASASGRRGGVAGGRGGLGAGAGRARARRARARSSAGARAPARRGWSSAWRVRSSLRAHRGWSTRVEACEAIDGGRAVPAGERRRLPVVRPAARTGGRSRSSIWWRWPDARRWSARGACRTGSRGRFAWRRARRDRWAVRYHPPDVRSSGCSARTGWVPRPPTRTVARGCR